MAVPAGRRFTECRSPAERAPPARLESSDPRRSPLSLCKSCPLGKVDTDKGTGAARKLVRQISRPEHLRHRDCFSSQKEPHCFSSRGAASKARNRCLLEQVETLWSPEYGISD
jgi:hypothetical protein